MPLPLRGLLGRFGEMAGDPVVSFYVNAYRFRADEPNEPSPVDQG
jgi:hypothetical protein